MDAVSACWARFSWASSGNRQFRGAPAKIGAIAVGLWSFKPGQARLQQWRAEHVGGT
jgi:hypothetical protein